jgi:pilus assembly protein Flp/PilA
MSKIRQFLKDVEGASMIEYAILASLISVVAIAAITTVGTNVNSTFTSIGSQLNGGSR